MRHLNKKLAFAATATALLGAIGASVAQTEPNETDSKAPQQKTEANASGQEIYFFRDQGNSPETDPAAHLMLIKHGTPVAETETTTTVAQATTTTTTTNDANTTTTMPSASDTSNTEAGNPSTTAAPADNTPALAPKADRN